MTGGAARWRGARAMWREPRLRMEPIAPAAGGLPAPQPIWQARFDEERPLLLVSAELVPYLAADAFAT